MDNAARLSGKRFTEGAQWPNLLRVWASIGTDLATTGPRRVADWNAVDCMIKAVGPKLVAEAKRLKLLLTESRIRLSPLEDPFDLDLGLHRWLDGEREEAFSDWLEWVVWQAKTPQRIFALIGLGSPPDDLRECQDFKVQRECCVPHGHVDQTGRLDLVIRLGDRAIIVVEVKTGDAEAADTAKQQGYSHWLAEQKFPHKHSIFLAVTAEDVVYEGFTFLAWQDVCIEMRRLAIDIRNEGRTMAAAIVLAFAAAVEQNLLGFSAERVLRICDGRASFFDSRVVAYMKRVVERLGV